MTQHNGNTTLTGTLTANKESKRDFELFTIQPDFQAMKKSPAFLEYIHWLQLQDRTLVINYDIDDSLIDEVINPIIAWNKEDSDLGLAPEERKPIKVYINTHGGDLDIAFVAMSVFAASKTPIHTIVLAKAYSCGAILLLAGHKRFAFDFSNILIHEGTMGMQNTVSKTRDYMDFSTRREAKLKEFIVGRSKITSEQYDNIYRKEFYVLGSEAKEYGIIDDIISVID